ncbi:MAG: ATP-binding protein [Actinomycetota bacterium]
MTGSVVQTPQRFRRRLALAFVLIAGLTSALFAAGSYVFVWESRRAAAVERAANHTRFSLSLAENILPTEARPADVRSLLSLYERRGGFETVVMLDDRRYASDPSLHSADLPRRGIEFPADGHVRTDVEGTPYIVTGGRATENVEISFLYSLAGLDRNLVELRNVLLIAWLLVLVGSGLAGRVLARRTLQPVAETSEAAHSLAEGLLDTRLPVQTDDEFGLLAASFNEMADALQAKIVELSAAHERERRFTSDVSHELRTPVAGLMTCASLLENHLDKVAPPARRPAELIVADIVRLRSLVEELMEIARLDSGRWTVESEPVVVNEFVSRIIMSNGWDLHVANGERVTLSTDPRRLERIIANLFANAVEHAGGRGVAVEICRSGRDVVIEVADEGPGIAPEHLPHVFERFFKADPSRTSRGSGLGLAIAAENARLLGGRIEAVSEQGKGSRFILRLPSVA